MDLGLKGKKVILTGGSRGIGRAALEIFAAEGCDVAFFSRNQAQVDDTKRSLARHGHRVVASTFDMNRLDEYPGWLSRAAEELGGCDIFVPGASSSGSQATGDWQKSYEFDLLGTVKGCETLEPHLEKSGNGSVVVMSSTAAVETFLVPQAFNAIKAALLTYAWHAFPQSPILPVSPTVDLIGNTIFAAAAVTLLAVAARRVRPVHR